MLAEHGWLERNMIHGGGGGGGDGWGEGCFWKILRNMVFGSWMVVVVLAVHTVRCPIMEWWEVGVLLKTIGWVVAENRWLGGWWQICNDIRWLIYH